MSTSLPAWQVLREHAASIRRIHMRDWFAGPPGQARSERLTAEACGLTLDYAKNRITEETLALLFELARQARVCERRDAMFAGEPVNTTERRAALHMALRAHPGDGYRALGVPVEADVSAVLAQMERFAHEVRSGTWTGFDGRAIRDVVNIGIGGSDLGPRMVCRALVQDTEPGPRLHFVANVDGCDLARKLARLDAATTLVIVCSKTFTTLETMANAHTARDWFLRHGATHADLARHFVAVSTNRDAVAAFGIDPANMFPFWDWVGGRFSLWSAVGLSIAVAIGFDRFRQLLDGARAMDRHFASAPPEQNLPMILGLLDVWYRSFLDTRSRCVAPYCEPLELLPAFLQQLEMESNGKSVQLNGAALQAGSAAVVWGTTGTNGQHAYFQMVHQARNWYPWTSLPACNRTATCPATITSCWPTALHRARRCCTGAPPMRCVQAGRLTRRWCRIWCSKGTVPATRCCCSGWMPFTWRLARHVRASDVVQGTLWNINPFDQWGVELGKMLARPIERELDGAPAQPHDASTAALIRRACRARAMAPD